MGLLGAFIDNKWQLYLGLALYAVTGIVPPILGYFLFKSFVEVDGALPLIIYALILALLSSVMTLAAGLLAGI